jgi:hypothetical protein
MKLKYYYILFSLFFGCNEFIDLTGKFINRLNDTNNLNITIKISAHNLQSEKLPNILISIIDDHDSLFIMTPKFTDGIKYLTFTLPDEQIKDISPGAQNIMVIAEHPEFGSIFNVIPINEIYTNHNITREFIVDIDPSVLLKKNIQEFPFYNNTVNKK